MFTQNTGDEDTSSCWSRATRWGQESCYQFLAATFWDTIVGGFRPARERSFEMLEIETGDNVLFVGEGTGLDFEFLPEGMNTSNVHALDYSSQMVSKAKARAPEYSIPEENCVTGDAQNLPYEDGQFNKIFFPLSLASIPDPERAIAEAERVLAPGGKIVVLEKLVDDEQEVSRGRQCLSLITNCIFADITRKLTDMLGDEPKLKLTQYESLNGQLNGCVFSHLGSHYRVATLVRIQDYPEQAAVRAVLT